MKKKELRIMVSDNLYYQLQTFAKTCECSMAHIVRKSVKIYLISKGVNIK